MFKAMGLVAFAKVRTRFGGSRANRTDLSFFDRGILLGIRIPVKQALAFGRTGGVETLYCDLRSDG